MSRVINEKLTTIEEKLGDIEKAVLAGKRAISYALKYSGVETTVPYDDNDQTYETFKFYADKIKALGHNPFIMEVTITEKADTDYKRSVVLPINFSSGYTKTNLNDIADEIIKGDTGTYSIKPNTMTEGGPVDENDPENHTVYDPFGNQCTDGEWVPTMEQIEEYLNDDEQQEMLGAMESLGIDAAEPKPLADDDPIYDYTVNWGDGTGDFVFDPDGTYNENKDAIWHTYAKAGTYEIDITGDFRYVASTRSADRPSARTSNGQYVYDADGTTQIRDGENYGMRTSLTAIVAWGNMRYTNMQYAFSHCVTLNSIPMYDTTNSFTDVTDFSYAFNYCQSLTSLPYNANTDKGLFSGCTEVTTFADTFRYCNKISSAIPDKFIDGCEKVTTVSNMFAYSTCSGDLPTGLFKGLTALTNAEACFASCSLNGDISEELFADCPDVTTIYRLFYGCTGLTGRITRNVFGHLSKLTTMRQAFYNCSKITGIDPDAFHGLSYSSTGEGLNCRQAFYGCTGIKEIPKGLFEGLSGDNLNYTDTDDTQKQWNNGEDFSALSGTGLLLENMFEACTGITTISSTALTNLKVANARGIFGGCTNLACALPDSPSYTQSDGTTFTEWDNFETMEKWYGAFGNCTKMIGYSGEVTVDDVTYKAIPFELGGLANRKSEGYNVGKIVLSNSDSEGNTTYSYVEPTEYYNGSKLVNGTPVGIVYADTVLDASRCIPTLSNALSRAGTNTADSETDETNRVHKLLVGALNDTTKTWVDAQNDAEDLPNITNTSTYTVGYSYFYWPDSQTQTKQYQRYNGEAYTRAINQFVVARGFSDIGDQSLPTDYTSYRVVVDTSISDSKDFVITSLPDASSAESNTVYFSMDDGATSRYSAYVAEGGTWVNQSDYDYIVNSSRYPAVSYANTYNTQVSAFAPGDCFLPDGGDIWDQFCMRDWLNDIITNRIIASGSHTSSTARTIRTGTSYWASAENSSTGAWACYTGLAGLGNDSKWGSRYVRPSLALTLSQTASP